MQRSVVEAALKNGDDAALAEIAELYDMHILDSNSQYLSERLEEILARRKKFSIVAKNNRLCSELAHTAFWVNMEKNGFLVKVSFFLSYII
jgi:hypothetical protein